MDKGCIGESRTKKDEGSGDGHKGKHQQSWARKKKPQNRTHGEEHDPTTGGKRTGDKAKVGQRGETWEEISEIWGDSCPDFTLSKRNTKVKKSKDPEIKKSRYHLRIRDITTSSPRWTSPILLSSLFHDWS